jgi:hypothetical protein
MTLVHRHIATSKEQTNIPSDNTNHSAFRTVTRTYAQAASIPVLSIRVPEPIATHNSYSALNDTITPSSNDSDKYMWNSHESSDPSESDIDYSDMPELIDESNDANDAGDERSESNESQSENTSDSDQEIIVNHTRYQRVRKSCKDSLPCPITFSFTLWAIAMFMQFIFQICGLVNEKCSRRL